MELGRKFVPLRVRMKAGPPAATDKGEVETRVGSGLIACGEAMLLLTM
jgi:hypothetical protein